MGCPYICRGHPNIQGASKHGECPNIWGCPSIQGASKYMGYPNIWGLQTYRRHPNMWVSKHTGGIQTYGECPNIWQCPNIYRASKHMGVSKHTGGIQTWGHQKILGASKQTGGVQVNGGVQTYRVHWNMGCLNIWGECKCMGNANVWGVQIWGEAKHMGASKHTGGILTYGGAKTHRGHPNVCSLKKKKQGESKHMGSVQTYGDVQTYRDIQTYCGNPNIQVGIQTWGHANIWGSKHAGCIPACISITWCGFCHYLFNNNCICAVMQVRKQVQNPNIWVCGVQMGHSCSHSYM